MLETGAQDGEIVMIVELENCLGKRGGEKGIYFHLYYPDATQHSLTTHQTKNKKAPDLPT